jgi:hypothetical protein
LLNMLLKILLVLLSYIIQVFIRGAETDLQDTGDFWLAFFC